MLTIGQQLYELTSRDQVTMFLEPYFRTLSNTVAAGVNNATASIPVPTDRSLFVQSFTLVGNPAALNQWTNLALNAISSSGDSRFLFAVSSINGLAGDGQVVAAPAGADVYFNRVLNLVLPPGTNRLDFTGVRAGNTNPAQCFALLNSYLIPPGAIGRA